MKNYKDFAQNIQEARIVPRLYHWSRAWGSILTDGGFVPKKMNDTEIDLLPKGKQTSDAWGDKYVSFTRSTAGSKYIGDRLNSSDAYVVIFELDAEKLRHRNKIVSVNWYKPLFNSSHPTNKSYGHTELEDRIITFRNFVPFGDALLGVHVLINTDEQALDVYKKSLRDAEEALKNASNEDYKEYYQDEIEYYSDLVRKAEMGDREIRAAFKRFSGMYPNIPFWLYHNPTHFISMRWAEADQMNTNLMDDDDELDEGVDLTEARVVPRLYHWSPKWQSILNDNLLFTSESWSAETFVLPRQDETKKAWGNKFISFARSIGGSAFIRGRPFDSTREITVVFEFDANKLRARHKIIPVNYFKSDDIKGIVSTTRSRNWSEYEDRLLTFKLAIPISESLLGVHVYIQQDEKRVEELKGYLAGAEEEYRQAKTEEGRDGFARDIRWYSNEIQRLTHLEIETRKEFEKFSAKYPNVPFWLYHNPKHFLAARYAEAEQINTNLAEDDEDE